MECPQCGYMMDDFTSECPRCARATRQGGGQTQPVQQAPAPQQRQGQSNQQVNRQQPYNQRQPAQASPAKSPLLLIGGIIAVALIACGIIFYPSLSKQLNSRIQLMNSHVEHVVCINGTKFAIDVPGDWGADRTGREKMLNPLLVFTPKSFPIPQQAAVSGDFSCFSSAQVVSREEFDENSFIGLKKNYDVQVTKGVITGSSGAQIPWMNIVLVRLDKRVRNIDMKIFYISGGSTAVEATFVCPATDFAQYESAFDAIARSLRFEQ